MTTDVEGRVTNLNAVAESLTGWTNADAAGRLLDAVFRIVNETTRLPVENPAARALREGVVVGLANHTILIAKDGTERPIDDSAAPIRSEDGEVIGCVLGFRDVTERRRAESLLTDQNRVLEQVIRGGSLTDALDAVCLAFERQFAGGVVATVLLTDESGTLLRSAAGRRCPVACSAAIDPVPVGSASGSCGTAAHRGQPAVVADIAEDPLWIDYRQVALSHGLRACWSVPVLSSTGAVLGTFAVYSLAPRRPSGHDLRMMEFLARTAGIAVERRRAEEAIRESELRYRMVGQAANDAIWNWNLTTNRVVWNEGLRRAFGYVEEQIGADASWWIEHIHADDRERVAHGIHAVIDGGGEFWSEEYRYLRADGSHADVFDCGRVERIDGRPVRMVGSMLDLTERKRLENQLRESESHSRTIVEGNPALICRFRLDGTLTFVNDTYCRTFGKAREELVGRPFSPFVPEEDRPVVARLIERLAPDMRPHTDEHRVVVVGGEVRWQRWTNMAVAGGGGWPEYRAVGIDVTDLKKLEDELRQIAVELSAADRKKDEFLAVLAHELRNPLAPIRNALQIMKLTELRGHREEARAVMGRQLEQMVRPVDELMDVSRITRGKVELRKERVGLARVVGSAVETSRPLVEQMGHDLVVALPESPIVLEADPTRLAQLFANLLTNAAKYSERGRLIRLTAERRADEVAVSVADSGIGIPADMLHSIFDMFSQVDRSLEKAQGGLGIGLMQVKRLREMHSGTVEAKSEGLGRGSEFVVRLPIAVESWATPNAGRGDHAAAKSALRILIVDDNRDGADSLSTMLQIMGHETKTAYDGEEGWPPRSVSALA